MTERINSLTYLQDAPGTDLFLDGPAEFLVKQIVLKLGSVEQFVALFGDSIDAYQRMDYSFRQLPALRVYTEGYRKTYDSWFIEGDVKLDLIWPANLRREQLQQFQATVGAALLQQFRRPRHFNELVAAVPGLNELGKTFSADHTLGFQWKDDILPLTQMVINFRIDIRVWDQYLESSSRTKDDPFEATLAGLNRIKTVIDGLRDNAETEVEIESDQKV